VPKAGYHLTVGYRQRQRQRECQRLRNAKGKAIANSASFGFWIEIQPTVGCVRR
jgi:hypothetical protein